MGETMAPVIRAAAESDAKWEDMNRDEDRTIMANRYKYRDSDDSDTH